MEPLSIVRKTPQTRVHVQTQPKPVTVYPEYPTKCLETLADQIDLNQLETT